MAYCIGSCPRDKTERTWLFLFFKFMHIHDMKTFTSINAQSVGTVRPALRPNVKRMATRVQANARYAGHWYLSQSTLLIWALKYLHSSLPLTTPSFAARSAMSGRPVLNAVSALITGYNPLFMLDRGLHLLIPL